MLQVEPLIANSRQRSSDGGEARRVVLVQGFITEVREWKEGKGAELLE